MYFQEIGPRYTAETYSLMTHSCNNLSNEVAQFLAGASVPEYVLNLPKEVAYDTKLGDDNETTHQQSSDAKSKEENVVPPTVVPAGTSEEKSVASDPHVDARSKVQEETGKEFAAMMASGTLRAREAAALVTKKVMQKYGHMNAAQS
ncbi:PPPDE putative peptidase domain-containing protein [Artemisia annua]|uniref:PPPDE putative peptidase domain-containing protein n=1 Tax=Artemisia annua TaxID=35608 RepID=A0A2U1M4Q6_ARTAN|nr:PPPDE putative peptidase domain-containing protein [Artemisia annua]